MLKSDKAQADKGFQPSNPIPIKPNDLQNCLDANEDGDRNLFLALNPDLTFDHDEKLFYRFLDGYEHPLLKGEEFQRLDRVINCYGDEANRLSWQSTQLSKKGKDTRSLENLRNRYLSRIRKLQTINRKKSVLQLATKGFGVTADEVFNCQEPDRLPCRNGVVDLKTGWISEGRPEQHIRLFSMVEWKDLKTPAPVWEDTLKQIFDGDDQLIKYVQRLLGYSCTGYRTEHFLPVFWGQGRNGKTTIMETVSNILGPYAYKCPADMLMDSGRVSTKGSADADTLAFRGKRLVLASETNENRKFNVAMLKELVGGDTLNARGLYQRTPTNFRPTHTLILMTNHKPHAPATDFAFWERVHLVPFKLSFVDRTPEKSNERRADKKLFEKLEAESSGILAWLVRGCLKWQQIGLAPPDSVRAATQEYKKSEDVIGRFIDDCCVVGPKCQVKAGELYKAYQIWASDMGERAISNKKFGLQIKTRFDSKKIHSVHYLGIGLRNEM